LMTRAGPVVIETTAVDGTAADRSPEFRELNDRQLLALVYFNRGASRQAAGRFADAVAAPATSNSESVEIKASRGRRERSGRVVVMVKPPCGDPLCKECSNTGKI